MKQYRPHLFVVFILALVLSSGIDVPLQNMLNAMRFSLLPRQVSGEIVLVAIDSPSLEAAGVWPWPRGIHANGINRLDDAGVTDIVFDVDFSSVSTTVADHEFEQALRKAGGSIVLPTFKQLVPDRGGGATIHIDRPLPRFAAHAWAASITVEPDADGLVRRYPLGSWIGDAFLPTAAAMMVGRFDGREGSFLLDFGIRASSIPTVSYIDVLRGVPAVMEKLKGKKVFIGATALELGDRVNLPNGRVVPGVILQAIAAESILQSRMLQNSSALVTLFGLGLIMLGAWSMWRRLSARARVGLLFALALQTELVALLLQAWQPIVLQTIFFQAAIAAYLVALALDEIDMRDLLGVVAEKRFQQVAMAIGDGLVCADRNGRITSWNAGAAAIFGYDSDDMLGQPFERIFVSKGPQAGFKATDLPLHELQSPTGKVMELEGRRKNGEAFACEACFSAWQGADGMLYGAVLRDISARRREEERIRYLARYDTLTGLPNRNTLYEHLGARIAAENNGASLALLLLDLDKFKDINDLHGHTCGDGVLSDVARRLVELAEGAELIARLGGDEFGIVLHGPDAADRAESLCETIARSFREREFVFAGHRFLIRCSIGVALYPRDCDNVQQLLSNADLAMFRAKAARKNHVMFDRAIRSELEHRLKLTAELERAAEQSEFELFYQPQVRLRDGMVVGAEALIRWRHPERGLVSPGEFIPILNNMSISDRVSAWVMETACRQARRWHQNGHEIQVGVNLSPCQFESGGLAASTARILAETGLPPALLELEVTENILLADDERAAGIFGKLRELGVHLALDDFGTGYASLNYLKKFPLTRIKIDQSFVRDITPDSNDATIVESTINLSRLLGLSVVAEGVETLATAELLMKLGCENAQGYYFGRPMDVAKFEQTVLAGSVPRASVDTRTIPSAA